MLKEILLRKNKASILAAAQLVLDDTRLFKELIVYIQDKKNLNLAAMAAWAMSDAVEQQPELLDPYYITLLEVVSTSKHGGIKRNIIRAFQFNQTPKHLIWEMADICLRFLSSKEEPIAVKACSITVLQQLITEIPEIKDEIIFELEKQLPFSTPAFTARANAFFKAMKKLEK